MRALVVAVLLVPALALAEECKELRAPDDQIQRQIQIAKSEPVQAIRKGIDEYLRGCRSSCRMLEPAAVADLGELDLVYLKSKFSLYLGDRFLGGGFMFTIVFQDRPDALFNAWVRQYPDSPGRWFVVRFLVAERDEARMKRFACEYGYYLRHPELNH